MTLNQRQSELLKLLQEKTRMSVKDLAKALYVSDMTIRRDLTLMEAEGYLTRYNGGAVFCRKEEILPITYRKWIRSREKTELSERTKKHLHDDMNVFIDSSSTCGYIVPILAEYRNIRVITNSVENLLTIADYHLPCLFAGGDYYEKDRCTVGSYTQDFLQNINVDVAFFSSGGISEDGIISDNDPLQTAVRKAVMCHSAKNIFLFDATKENRRYLYTLCTSDRADEIICI